MNYWPGTNYKKSHHTVFTWRGQPSIFTKKGEVNPSIKQVVDNATRHNHEATLGANAGFTIGKKK